MDSNSEMTRPPLHTACLLGDEPEVQKLLKLGADVEEVDFAGCTSIQLAAASGFLNIAKILLANGAKPEKQDSSHGNTSLHEGSWRGYSALVKLLAGPATINVQNNGGFSPLHLACQAGHNQSSRELLLSGSNPNLVNTYGDTPLHTAVRYGHAGVTRILLSARTLPDIQNKNGDTALHIAAAMGRKKLTRILLSAGCNPELQNHQNETPLGISLRKGFGDVAQAIQNPPNVLTPLQRDQMRASKYKGDQEAGPSRKRLIKSVAQVHSPDPSASKTSESAKAAEKRSLSSKNTSSANLKEGGSARQSPGSRGSKPKPSAIEEVPKWSPYGCHYHPNPGAFPPPNIDSLPTEPLTTGELYYLDLAGNIHKGPMGVSEGCYCGSLLSQNQNSQSMVALNVHGPAGGGGLPKRRPKGPSDPASAPSAPPNPNKYENQLQSLTNQLSKIHLDTQAQLSSLHSMLNERLKEPAAAEERTEDQEGYNEGQLKDWVKQYRRFRKELTKNPKTLHQASELLVSASALLSTRLASPAPPDSDTDSGI